MNESRPVLVLAGTGRVAVAIARCLGRHGVTVDVAQAAGAQPAIASRSIRYVHRFPDFLTAPVRFQDALNGALEKYGYDMLIPTTDESLLAISPCYDALCRRLYPGCPRPEIVNAVLDKRLTLAAARQGGIRTPREYQFLSIEELEAGRDALVYPLIAKSATKADQLNFALRYYRDFEQLRGAFVQDPSFGCKYLLQEYCPGYGVGVEMLVWEGRVQATFQHRRLKELPSTGGVSVLAEAQAPDPVLSEAATQLLQRLGWRGVAMVEFRYDPETGQAVLMEVNGRYWGSLPLSVNAGIEFPYYEWQLAHGLERPGPVAVYNPGFRTLWRMGDLMRFLSLVMQWKAGQLGFPVLGKEAWAWMRDFCSRSPDALWQWRDPEAALLEFQARILKPVGERCSPRKWLPRGLVHEASVYRRFGLRAGWLHTRFTRIEAPGLRGRDLKALVQRSKTILFVCSGNIIRSPLAAELARRELKGCRGVAIESAGLFAAAGSAADPAAAIAAREIGVPLADHRSTLLTAEMVERAGVIFVMDYINEAVLAGRFPQAARKTFLLGACGSAARGGKTEEIPDPCGLGLDAVRLCYGEVREGVQALCELMRSETA